MSKQLLNAVLGEFGRGVETNAEYTPKMDIYFCSILVLLLFEVWNIMILTTNGGIDMDFMSAREAADAISEEISADVVAVSGNRFVLYRRSEKKPKIELPR